MKRFILSLLLILATVFVVAPFHAPTPPGRPLTEIVAVAEKYELTSLIAGVLDRCKLRDLVRVPRDGNSQFIIHLSGVEIRSPEIHHRLQEIISEDRVSFSPAIKNWLHSARCEGLSRFSGGLFHVEVWTIVERGHHATPLEDIPRKACIGNKEHMSR